MNCAATPEAYPTHMDGVDGFSCQRWSGCEADNEIVFCTGDHGHDYPFSGHYIDGLSIMWDFMKTHKNSIWHMEPSDYRSISWLKKSL